MQNSASTEEESESAREQLAGLDRIPLMGRRAKLSLVERQALNRLLIYAAHPPPEAFRSCGRLIRNLRVMLRMTQANLAARSGIPQAQIARIENGRVDPRLSTAAALFEAMFCELVVLPRPRLRPGDAIAERALLVPEYLSGRWLWDDRRLAQWDAIVARFPRPGHQRSPQPAEAVGDDLDVIEPGLE